MDGVLKKTAQLPSSGSQELDFVVLGIIAETEQGHWIQSIWEEKEVKGMYPAMLLSALMIFTWGAAVWASLRDDDTRERPWESERSQKRAA